MSKLKHTDGPVRVDGQNIIAHEAEIGIAKVYGNISQPREGNARLLAAAYNAFDSAARRLGCNAVELAEAMQNGGIAELVEGLRDSLDVVNSDYTRDAYEHEPADIRGQVQHRIECLLAKMKGPAT